MGREATIKRRDGSPLGELAWVKEQIALELPGVIFRTLPSGPEFLKWVARHQEVPEVLRKHFESSPESVVAELSGEGFRVELDLGSSPVVQEIGVRLEGDGALFERLERRTGWVVVHPGSPATDEDDRAYYQSLAEEGSDTKCARPDCARGAISFSFYCRRHHFEMMKGRLYRFED